MATASEHDNHHRDTGSSDRVKIDTASSLTDEDDLESMPSVSDQRAQSGSDDTKLLSRTDDELISREAAPRVESSAFHIENLVGEFDTIRQRYASSAISTARPCESQTLAQQAAASIALYQEHRRKTDLESAIRDYRQLVQETKPEHPCLPSRQSTLCDTLCEYADLWGDERLVREAVRLGELACGKTPTASLEYADALCCYARALCLWYEFNEVKGETTEIIRAISLLEAHKTLHPNASANSADFLMVYGRALFHRFEALSQRESLEVSIDSYKSAILLMDDSNMKKAQCMTYLSTAYMRKLDRLHDTADISNRVNTAKAVIALCRPDDPRRPRYLNSLGLALHREWLLTGSDVKALDLSISYCRQSLNSLQPGDRLYPVVCSALSTAMLDRYENGGNLSDLNECVHLSELAVQGEGALTTGATAYLYNLSRSLLIRFRDTGHTPDIDRAITLLKEHLVVLPTSYSKRVHILSALGSCLLERYYVLKQLSDVQLSLQLNKEVTETLPSVGGYLANVGECHYWIYLHGRDMQHLEDSIICMEQAQKKLESIWQKSEFYINFGNAFVARAQVSHNRSDWNAAVDQFRLALEYGPPGHKSRPQALRKLGTTLKEQFEDGEGVNVGDITEALAILQDCLKDEATSFERVRCAAALGDALNVFYQYCGGEVHLTAATDMLRKAAEDVEGSINDRFAAALSWGRLAEQHAQHRLQFEAYSLAVELLPRVAWLGFRKDVRIRELRAQAASLAVDAAASAIELGRLERAVELLESGRGVFWSQLLQLRTEGDDLREVAPDLAREMQEVGQALELDVGQSGGLESEPLLQRQRRLAERWEQLVTQARQLAGFEDFLHPPKFSELAAAATAGPVVILNCSRLRCDALVLTSDSRLWHCPLPTVKAEMMLQLSNFLAKALGVTRDRTGLSFLEGAIAFILDHLWYTVCAPIWKTITEGASLSPPHRIWLCPTGPLCLLPLHAAGPHLSKEGGLPDLVACSYTATLSALLRARSSAHDHGGRYRPRILAVNQPATPGYDALTFSVAEMRMIRDSPLSQHAVFMSGEEATVARVSNAMQDNNWIHLSCHGSSQADDPLKSCFHLHDGPLSLSDISEQRLPYADFAFLSACHTARNSASLPDESLHLAASLQLAGFKSIVGTQWGIADKDAPEVARDVYGHMTQAGNNDYTSAAQGLHKAVSILRGAGVPAQRWVPFIHIGV